LSFRGGASLSLKAGEVAGGERIAARILAACSIPSAISAF
jgi:hypothetical protein